MNEKTVANEEIMPWYKKAFNAVKGFVSNNMNTIIDIASLVLCAHAGYMLGRGKEREHIVKEKVDFTNKYLEYITPKTEQEYVLKRHEDNSFTQWTVDEYIASNYDLIKKEDK